MTNVSTTATTISSGSSRQNEPLRLGFLPLPFLPPVSAARRPGPLPAASSPSSGSSPSRPGPVPARRCRPGLAPAPRVTSVVAVVLPVSRDDGRGGREAKPSAPARPVSAPARPLSSRATRRWSARASEGADGVGSALGDAGRRAWDGAPWDGAPGAGAGRGAPGGGDTGRAPKPGRRRPSRGGPRRARGATVRGRRAVGAAGRRTPGGARRARGQGRTLTGSPVRPVAVGRTRTSRCRTSRCRGPEPCVPCRAPFPFATGGPRASPLPEELPYP